MEGLLLCHADARADDEEGGAHLVTLTPLAEEVAAGKDDQYLRVTLRLSGAGVRVQLHWLVLCIRHAQNCQHLTSRGGWLL